MKRTVNFYRTKAGKCPVEKFLNSLSGKVAKKITWVLQLIEDLDVVPKTYFSKMSGTEGIWECRIQLGSNIYRIFAFIDGKEVILTHGIVKKGQKTPKKEIQQAEKIKREYYTRHKRGKR